MGNYECVSLHIYRVILNNFIGSLLRISLMSLDSRIQDASEKENFNIEMEETYALIGKLMTENADLVEKVSRKRLCMQLMMV